jgi:ribosomal protein S27AE
MEKCAAVTMPRKQKIDRDKVMASLDAACPKCGCSITPDKVQRIDFARIECPVCHEQFIPSRKGSN